MTYPDTFESCDLDRWPFALNSIPEQGASSLSCVQYFATLGSVVFDIPCLNTPPSNWYFISHWSRPIWFWHCVIQCSACI